MKRPFSPTALPDPEPDHPDRGISSSSSSSSTSSSLAVMAVLGGQMTGHSEQHHHLLLHHHHHQQHHQQQQQRCGDPQKEGVVPEERPAGGALPSVHHRAKRERKQRSYTLCDVCNIQLNSPAQAQIHYNGKSHQKRLKQISKGKIPASSTGTTAQANPLLASLPVPGRALQPQLDLKHFLPFRLNGSSPLSLFPNFNTMDPVQKAVINHTFGVPQPLKKKQIISCNICHLRFNSTNQAEAHYKGHKHARKLKAIEAQKNRQRRSGEASGRERDREKDRERDRDRERNKTAVPETPPSLMERASIIPPPALEAADLEGKMEESPPSSSAMLTPESEVSSADSATLSPLQVSPSPQQHSETASDAGTPESVGSGSTDTGTGSPVDAAEGEACTDEDKDDPKKAKAHLHCPVCKVTVNSTSQLDAHNTGTKHKLMLEGQPVQPRRRGKAVAARSACKSKRLGSKGSLGVPSKNFQCEVCEIFVNSETQLSQHMNSRRHKDRLAGKPPKPKFTPHNKTQQSTSLASVRWSGYAGGTVSAMKKVFSQYNLTTLSSQTKLALQKQLTKTLTATSFLPSALTQPALCAMAANPLALRHPGGTTTFIQSPFLGPTLFRPAPGPLRATHTPIIFSPY